MSLRRLCIAALALLWLAPGAGMAMSEKKELEIGREMHQEILAKMPVYANAAVADNRRLTATARSRDTLVC